MYTEIGTDVTDVQVDTDTGTIKATVVTVETTYLDGEDWDYLSTADVAALEGREERTETEVKYEMEVEYHPHASGDSSDTGGWHAVCYENRNGMNVWAGDGPVDDGGWETTMALDESILDALSELAVALRDASDLCEVCRAHGICAPATQEKVWVEGTAPKRVCNECANA